MDICDDDLNCEAVECGETYCSWWANDKCNDAHELSDRTSGSIHTCVKIPDDNGKILELLK